MLDGTNFFECQCYSDEHTLRFVLDKEDKQFYVSIFLCRKGMPFWKRIWNAVKYVFKPECGNSGQFCSWVLCEEDVERMKAMLDELPPAWVESVRVDVR